MDARDADIGGTGPSPHAPSPQGPSPESPSPQVTSEALPLPPEDMRALVGVLDPTFFDNPTAANALPEIGERAYGAVFDFGSGCGRIARRLLQQDPQPTRYVGVDLHAGMVRWCQENLAPHADQFSFSHHDVANVGFNPTGVAPYLPFPVDDRCFDAVVAHSVFTHVVESAALHYLRECARILSPGGMLLSTWFLFDKSAFPMMQAFQNALYINDIDPTNACIFDRSWLIAATKEVGLVITAVTPPAVRGFHWAITMEPVGTTAEEVDFPEDHAPLGSVPPPMLAVFAAGVGSGPEFGSAPGVGSGPPNPTAATTTDGGGPAGVRRLARRAANAGRRARSRLHPR